MPQHLGWLRPALSPAQETIMRLALQLRRHRQRIATSGETSHREPLASPAINSAASVAGAPQEPVQK